MGSKGQTYDQIINELIKVKEEEIVDGGVESLSSSRLSSSTGVLL
jgi:hypothetical protein